MNFFFKLITYSLSSFIIYTKLISTCSDSVSFHALRSGIAYVIMSQDAIAEPKLLEKVSS